MLLVVLVVAVVRVANYRCSYFDDTGKLTKFYPCQIFLNTSNGIQQSSTILDREYLPAFYFDYLLEGERPACKNPSIVKPRQGVIKLDIDFSLIFTIPFLGGSAEFIKLFLELDDLGLKARYHGEILRDFYLNWLYGN